VPEIAVRVAPSPGTVSPGNLYVDLQTVTLWLGVNTSVDPDGAKLVSDIEGTLDLIAEVLQDANAYTNQEVASRAPKDSPIFTGNPQAPTPAASDNDQSIATTGFVKQAVGVQSAGDWTAGMIMAWAGLVADIGVGSLSNWAPCDGSARSRSAYPELFSKLGTIHGVGDGSTTFNLPDLRERFVMGAGAGTRAVGSKNPTSATATTDVQGTHAHTVSGRVLDVQHLPPHQHGPGDLGGSTIGSTTTAAAGTTVTVLKAGAAGVTVGTAAMSTGATGNPTVAGSSAHDHTEISNGAHDHSLTVADVREVVPYYALAYMIRLKT
jgi:microcystin-dependent protein